MLPRHSSRHPAVRLTWHTPEKLAGSAVPSFANTANDAAKLLSSSGRRHSPGARATRSIRVTRARGQTWMSSFQADYWPLQLVITYNMTTSCVIKFNRNSACSKTHSAKAPSSHCQPDPPTMPLRISLLKAPQGVLFHKGSL